MVLLGQGVADGLGRCRQIAGESVAGGPVGWLGESRWGSPQGTCIFNNLIQLSLSQDGMIRFVGMIHPDSGLIILTGQDDLGCLGIV